MDNFENIQEKDTQMVYAGFRETVVIWRKNILEAVTEALSEMEYSWLT